MSTWLRETNDVAVREHRERLRIDKGIEGGWGTEGLFDLAYRYFYQTFKYVQSISPETAYVMDIEDLDEPGRTENIMRQLCHKIGLDYHADMVKWRLLFGEECPRLVDGIRRPLGHPERRYLHRTILASSGLGRTRSKASMGAGVDAAAYLRPSTIGALNPLYEAMRNRRLVA
jgi:hypothetical protein